MELANPYAPPRVDVVAPALPLESDEDHEAIRREHLSTESTLRVLGWLSLVQSFEVACFAFVYIVSRFFRAGAGADAEEQFGAVVAGAVGLTLVAVSGWKNARELIDLEPQQHRKHTLGLALGFLGWLAVPIFIPGFVQFLKLNPLLLALILGSLTLSTPLKLFAFWSPKARTVFSDHYRDVVIRWTQRTLRPGVPPLAWLLMALTASKIAGEVLLIVAVMARWRF
jgi:hypothetical protein